MNDLIGRLTFGFLMAQLIPGAILFLALAFMSDLAGQEVRPVVSVIYDRITSTPEEAEHIGDPAEGQDAEAPGFISRLTSVSKNWAEPDKLLFFILSSISLGLLLHGLNWTTIAYLENSGGAAEGGHSKPKPMFQRNYHSHSAARQILWAPIMMLCEVGSMLFKSTSIYDLAIQENIDRVPADELSKHKFLQDFYLYFAQFYAHLAYAVLVVLLAQAVSILLYEQPSYTKAVLMFVALWFSNGILFVFARAQFCALFVAEEALKVQSVEASD